MMILPLLHLLFIITVALSFQHVAPKITARSSIGHHGHDGCHHRTFLKHAATDTIATDATDTTRATTTSQNDKHASAQVFDNAFPPLACQVIHALAAVHASHSHNYCATSIFQRPPLNTTQLTPLEHAIDSALNAMNDTSGNVVEYWSRDEHMNIDAHVDIDENYLEDEGEIVHPAMAHVLYLEVQRGLVGPTVVFPGKNVGWGFADANSLVEGVDGGLELKVEVEVIPAVRGRVLRFPGSSMHAVPCPAARWLLPREEEELLRCSEEEEEVDEEEEDDHDDDDQEDDFQVERSVLLFNTWSDDGPPPRDVQMGYDTAIAGNECHTPEDEQTLIHEWQLDYGMDAEFIRCNPPAEWRLNSNCRMDKKTTIPHAQSNPSDTASAAADVDNTAMEEARVYLMGGEERRLYDERIARLRAPKDQQLHNALMQSEEVTRLCLTEEWH